MLEELADLLENIDNSVVFGLKKYWKQLIDMMNETKSDRVYCALLDCFNKGLHNCDQAQDHAIEQGIIPIVKENLDNLTSTRQKPLLGILSAFYQNPKKAATVHSQLGVNFVQVYLQHGFKTPRLEFLMERFSLSCEDDKAYNELVKGLLK